MIEVRTFGESVIEIGPHRIGPSAERVFAAALFIVANPGRPIGRSELLELLWPPVRGARVSTRTRHSLRQILYRLRSLGLPVAVGEESVRLEAVALHADFAELVAGLPLSAIEERHFAPFLPGYEPAFSPAYAQWLERLRDAVQSALRRSLLAGLSSKKASGDWVRVEEIAKRCLLIDPLNEQATFALAAREGLAAAEIQAVSAIPEPSGAVLAAIAVGVGAMAVQQRSRAARCE